MSAELRHPFLGLVEEEAKRSQTQRLTLTQPATANLWPLMQHAKWLQQAKCQNCSNRLWGEFSICSFMLRHASCVGNSESKMAEVSQRFVRVIRLVLFSVKIFRLFGKQSAHPSNTYFNTKCNLSLTRNFPFSSEGWPPFFTVLLIR